MRKELLKAINTSRSALEENYIDGVEFSTLNSLENALSNVNATKIHVVCPFT